MSIRQTRKPPVRRESTSTISSNEANDMFREIDQGLSHQSGIIPSNLNSNQVQMNFNASSGINIGGTNVYYSLMSKVMVYFDSKNPAFILNTDNLSYSDKTRYILSQKWCWGLIFLVLLLITFCNTLVVVLWPRQPVVVVVTHDDWGAAPPVPGLDPLRLPADRVISSHTNDLDESCTTRDECASRMKALQTYYQDRGLSDIPWNFVIGDDDRIYEGRGFRFMGEVPVPGTSTFDNLGVHIAFMGTFTDRDPSPRQISTFNSFLDNSVRRDMLRSNFTLFLEDQLTFAYPQAVGVLNVAEQRPEFHNMLPIISRMQWGATDPIFPEVIERFLEPVPRIFSFRVQGTFECESLDECRDLVNLHQVNDIESGMNDIRFNFVISPHGVFEGRGWDVRPQGLIDGAINTLSIGFITPFLYRTGEFLNATLADIISDGILIGKLTTDVEREKK